MKFQGFPRKNGSIGIRNMVAVITCTGCINELPKLISEGIPGTIAVGHNLSCSHLGDDLERSTWTLANLAGNANVYGVVFTETPERLLQEMVSVASGQKQTMYEKGTYEEPLLIQIDGPSI